MATMVCPQCKRELPASSPFGLCPSCLLGLAKPEPLPKIRYIGDYELLEKIAEGGMGVVFRARQVTLDRLVALKMIRAGMLASSAEVERFRREAEAAAALDHPNIVGLYEVGEHEGQPYFTMKLVAGESLARRISRGPLANQEAARLMVKVARAVHHAHERGVLHRDLKPGNILLDEQGEPYLTDFGLAKLLRKAPGISLTTNVLGTLEYMAPEQASKNAKSVTTAADVYSLGAILYTLLVGHPPFPQQGDNWLDVSNRVANEEPPAPRTLNPAVDLDLNTICLRCLEKEPQKRYRHALEFAEELQRFLDGEPILARPVGWTGRAIKWCRRNPVVAGLLAAVGVSLVLYLITTTVLWRRADAARAETVESLSLLRIKTAEGAFQAHDNSSGLSYLAAVLRMDPSNREAAERILSVLYYRDIALPLIPPFKHSKGVRSAQFSPDGLRVVTTSRDVTAQVWDVRTSQPLAEPLKHAKWVNSAQFSPDGLRVVTASVDGTAWIWDARTGQPLTEPLEHSNWVNSAQFSPDGLRVVTASTDKTARIWDARTGQPLTKPLKHEDGVNSAQFSPDGLRLVTASTDKTARIWDAQTGQPLTEPLKHEDGVTSAQFSPDGLSVFTTLGGGTVQVWDARTGQPMAGPLKHSIGVISAQFSPDGLRMVTASTDKTARVWDVRTGQPLAGPLKHEDVVTSAQFSPDGLRVVTVSMDNTARVWDAWTAQPLTEPLVHENQVNSAQFSPNGQWVVTASDDKLARVWDVRTGQPLSERIKHEGEVSFAEFSPNGLWLVTSSRDNVLRVWDTRTGQPLTELLMYKNGGTSAQFSPDGQRVVTASVDKTARVWDARTGQPLTKPLKHEDMVTSAQFSPDGQRVVTASADRTARVWDVRTGQPLTGPLKHLQWVNSAQFSPDGLRVVTASTDKTARIWDARTGQPLTLPLRHENFVNSAQFSPDVLRVVTASADNTARIWDARTGQLLTEPLRHLKWVTAAQFSPDGLRVVTASQDSTARVWDVRTGQPLTPSLKHDSDVTSAQFSPDGLRVLTASRDKTVRVWDARTGQPLTESLKHEGWVWSALFSPNGQRVLTASKEDTVRVWELSFYPQPFPSCLAHLAEALAGQRYVTRNLNERLKGDEYFRLKKLIENDPSTNAHIVWAKWFFADRSTRTISPFSTITIPEHIRSLIALGTLSSLREAVMLSPTNSLALARLAVRVLTQNTTENPNRIQEASSYCFAASKWAPDLAEVWLARTKLFQEMGPSAEALEFVQKATDRFPQEPEIWESQGRLLAATNRWPEAVQAYTKAIELTASETNRISALKKLAFGGRAEAYLRWGETKKDLSDILSSRGMLPRALETPRELLDLSTHYNAVTHESWHNYADVGNDLASLRNGLQTMGGCRFDVRGIVQLASLEINKTQSGYPTNVMGVAVNQECRVINFLEGTGWHVQHDGAIAKDGEMIAKYVAHYVDNQTVEIPVVYGQHLRNWQAWKGMPGEGKEPEPAWIGTQERWKSQPAMEFRVRLYVQTWQNPRPAVEIQSLDFISFMTTSAPFLLAITVEP